MFLKIRYYQTKFYITSHLFLQCNLVHLQTQTSLLFFGLTFSCPSLLNTLMSYLGDHLALDTTYDTVSSTSPALSASSNTDSSLQHTISTLCSIESIMISYKIIRFLDMKYSIARCTLQELSASSNTDSSLEHTISTLCISIESIMISYKEITCF